MPEPSRVSVPYLLVSVLTGVSLLLNHGLRLLGTEALPESVVCTLVGLVASLFYHRVYLAGEAVLFDPRAFLFLILPLIIFEGGISADRVDLLGNAKAVALFAIPGALASAIGISSGIAAAWLLTPSRPWSMRDTLQIGAILCSTDPSATLTLFSALDLDDRLEALIFGESIFNDAVAVALFEALTRLNERVSAASIAVALPWFLGTFLGSGVVGAAIALVAALVLKHGRISLNPPLEHITVIGSAYLAYYLADSCQLSGIIAIFFFALVAHKFVFANLDEESRHQFVGATRNIKYLCEHLVFVTLGFTLRAPAPTHWTLVVSTAAATLAWRGPVVWALNRIGQLELSAAEQLLVWNAGSRGGIAYALSLSRPAPTDAASQPDNRNQVQFATHVAVVATILLHGLFAPQLARWIKRHHATAARRTDPDTSRFARLVEWAGAINSRYVRPFFTIRRTNEGTPIQPGSVRLSLLEGGHEDGRGAAAAG